LLDLPDGEPHGCPRPPSCVADEVQRGRGVRP
jgi:hypothetical protein